MAETILCKICGKRRARRACPAVQGDICTLCCGAEREVSLSCPLECEYLQEAHQHERPIPVSDEMPNPDISVKEEFLVSHEKLLVFSAFALSGIAANTPGAVDSDVIAALEALIQTYKTLDSGLVYETRAANNIAARVQRDFSDFLKDYEKGERERHGFSLRNSDILTMLVFLHRAGRLNQNGRPRGRMFMDVLRRMGVDAGIKHQSPGIIL